MNAAQAEIEAEVARGFDAATRRFKAAVDADDYRLAAIVAELGDVAGLEIIDVGCGKGRFAVRLRSLGARVVGLDLSTEMLAGAAGLARAKASASRLPIPDRTFDAVLSVETLQHVAAIDAAVSEAFRVLRDGGRYLIVDKHAHALNVDRPWLPNLVVKAIDERRGRGMYGRNSAARERWRTSRRMLRALSDAGFVDLRSRGLPSPAEAEWTVFRRFDWTRAMRIWSGRRPGATP